MAAGRRIYRISRTPAAVTHQRYRSEDRQPLGMTPWVSARPGHLRGGAASLSLWIVRSHLLPDTSRMDRVRCASCGEEHDLSDLEPGFTHPDAYLEVPPEDRHWRTLGGKDERTVRDDEDSPPRYFFRCVLPVPVHGEPDPRCWGVWVEVDHAAWTRVRELWRDEDQHLEPPFPATLANEIPGYPPTLGLRGQLQLSGPRSVPGFRLSPGVDHPLAEEQRRGVPLERVLEWLWPQLH
jgi:hypothetical protein